MDFKLQAWAHAETSPPTEAHEQLATRFGASVVRMTLLTPPLARAYHRIAFDLSVSPRGRVLAMCAVTYLMSPLDFLPASPSRPAETLVDDLYVAWRVLDDLLRLHGMEPLERHWRANASPQELLGLLVNLPTLERAVPEKTLSQINLFLQLALGR